MPITVFDCRGLSASRRERIEPAVATGGKHVTGLYEAWISADTRGNVKVTVTGPQGFERRVMFELDEEPATISDRVRQTLDDE